MTMMWVGGWGEDLSAGREGRDGGRESRRQSKRRGAKKTAEGDPRDAAGGGKDCGQEAYIKVVSIGYQGRLILLVLFDLLLGGFPQRLTEVFRVARQAVVPGWGGRCQGKGRRLLGRDAAAHLGACLPSAETEYVQSVVG